MRGDPFCGDQNAPSADRHEPTVERYAIFLHDVCINGTGILRCPVYLGGIAIRPKTKIVRCCHCRGMMRVSARALSVACPHCQKRVALESIRIIGSHPGKSLATCGDVVIEERARLHLDVYGDHVLIAGRVTGNVVGSSTVEVGPTALVVGDITAPQIVVRDGAQIDGHCKMTGLPDYALDDEAEDDVAGSEAGFVDGEGDLKGNEDSEYESEVPRPSFQPRPLRPPPGTSKQVGFERVDRSEDMG